MSKVETESKDAKSKTKSVKILTGNHAAAWACKGANVGVVAAYPITPQSLLWKKYLDLLNRARKHTVYHVDPNNRIRRSSRHLLRIPCIHRNVG